MTVTGLALTGAQAADYSLTASSASGNIGAITPKALTAALTGTITKTYDGTTTATLTSANYAALTGVISGDTVALNTPTTATYASKNVGKSLGVTVTGLALTGAQAADYSLTASSASGNIGAITPKALTAALTGTITKTYDGTTTATLTSANYAALTGVISGDTVALNTPTTATYASKNVGNSLGVTVTGLALTGAQAADYSLNSTSAVGNIGAITPKALTAALMGTITKTYDGTINATLTSANYAALTGVISGDTVTLNTPASGTYAQKDAGSSLGVTVTGLALTGAQAADYSLAATTVTARIGTITPKALTAALTGTITKTYDGTTTATLTTANYNLTGVISGDTVSLNDPTSGAYASAGASSSTTTAIKVTVSGLALQNNLKGDYSLSSTSASANIGTINHK